jgi:hypothetical protein
MLELIERALLGFWGECLFFGLITRERRNFATKPYLSKHHTNDSYVKFKAGLKRAVARNVDIKGFTY